MNREFLNRAKLLMEYDSSKTLTENQQILLEFKVLAKLFGKMSKAAADDVFLKASKVGGLKTTLGTKINSADDLTKALSAGQLTRQSLGKVETNMLRSTLVDRGVKTSLIDDMVANPKVTKEYIGMSKKQIYDRALTRGYTDDVAEEFSSKMAKTNKATVVKSPNVVTPKVTPPKVKRTRGGKTKNLKPKRKKTIPPKTEEQILETAAKNPGWNWGKWLKWGAGLGIGGGLIWWFFFSNDDIPVPDDMPDTQPDDQDGGGERIVSIPSELGDAEGVKKFQDWADKNHAGWAWGYPDGKVNQVKGYGKFGPRTRAAWAKYKDEYLKGVTTPTVTQTATVVTPPVDDNQVLDGDTY